MPAYYCYVRISDLEAIVSWRSKSRLKVLFFPVSQAVQNMNNVRLSLIPYVKHDQFLSQKELFDNFAKYILGNRMTLFTEIIKTKIFGQK